MDSNRNIIIVEILIEIRMVHGVINMLMWELAKPFIHIVKIRYLSAKHQLQIPFPHKILNRAARSRALNPLNLSQIIQKTPTTTIAMIGKTTPPVEIIEDPKANPKQMELNLPVNLGILITRIKTNTHDMVLLPNIIIVGILIGILTVRGVTNMRI